MGLPEIEKKGRNREGQGVGVGDMEIGFGDGNGDGDGAFSKAMRGSGFRRRLKWQSNQIFATKPCSMSSDSRVVVSQASRNLQPATHEVTPSLKMPFVSSNPPILLDT